jgi:hypothetical protein
VLWFRVESDCPANRTSKRVLKHLGAEGFGGMVLLWCFAAASGKDDLSPGRCVDSDMDPIPREDLVVASTLSEETFDALIAILLDTKTVDRQAWTERGELVFPGLSSRADRYTQSLARSRPVRQPAKKAPSPPEPHPLDFISPEPPPAPTQSRFDAFWALYPKHTTRKQAAAIWGTGERYAKGLKVEQNTQLYETIMAALTKHVQAWADEGKDRQFILSPYQYLKHRRWEDEIPPPPSPTRSTRTRQMQEAAAAFLASAPKVIPSDAESA